MYQSFFLTTEDPSLLLLSSHDYGLVILSLCISVFASGVALQLANHARTSESVAGRQVSILIGSFALGAGIWSMHFIGILAFQLCASFSVNGWVTILSMFPSLGASWIALSLITRRSISWRQLMVGGLLVGGGIGAMHYSGMAALEMSALLRYRLDIFLLSILVAVALAVVSLWVSFGLKGYLTPRWAVLIGAVVMGLAISGMHYTGMAAATFVGEAELSSPRSMVDSTQLAVTVSVVTMVLGSVGLVLDSLLSYRHMSRRLAASEQHLRSIFDTAADVILTVDDQGVVRSCNSAIERVLGWSLQDVLDQPIDKLLPERYCVQIYGQLRRYLSGENTALGAKEVQMSALANSAEEVPVSVSIGVAKTGNRPLFVVFVTDIRVRLSMERALRESERQYRSLISNIPGVAFRRRLDESWSVLFVSDSVSKLTGWSADEFQSGACSLSDMCYRGDRDKVLEAVEQARQNGDNYTVEYRLLDRHGNEHWVWESGSPVADDSGDIKWIDGVLFDHTETKRRNAEYEGKVTAISKAMALMEFDLAGNVTAVNDNAAHLLGYSEAEMLGRHHSVFCDADQAASSTYKKIWEDLWAGNFHAGEFRRITKEGREIWIQASYNPILDVDGKPFKVVKLATDITPRRLMEQALRDARDRAEAAAAARGSFLANMSHEIRTPMNAIIGFAELLLDSPLADEQRRYLTTVQQSARSLLGLLNDILDTAKLDRGAIELENIDFSLRELCEQVCATQRLAAESKGLRLILDYPHDVNEFFRGDPMRLQQVITNLLGNAVKFTQHGHVELSVSGEPGAMRISVRDTGIGIAHERLDKIFEPFAQADASMSRRFGGTGLGTSISRQLVELMEGRIRVDSILGVGSNFIIEVPLQAGKRLAPQQRLLLPELGQLRILAADDVAQNLELVQITLERLGHQVHCVRDGEAAVHAYTEHTFDIILMDVQMPGVDGLEASQRIRAIEHKNGRAPIPIIALTASVMDHERQAALDAGMNAFACKPLDLNALLWEMARLLGISDRNAEAVAVEVADGYFDWVKGSALWGSPMRMSKAVRSFLDEQRTLVSDLNGCLYARDWGLGRALAHRVFGASGNLALPRLHELGRELEKAFDQQEEAALPELIARLEYMLMALESATPRLDDVSEVKPAGNLAQLHQRAVELRQVVARGGLDDDVLTELEEGLHSSVQLELGQSVSRALNNFDFDKALEALDKLIAVLNSEIEGAV